MKNLGAGEFVLPRDVLLPEHFGLIEEVVEAGEGEVGRASVVLRKVYSAQLLDRLDAAGRLELCRSLLGLRAECGRPEAVVVPEVF